MAIVMIYLIEYNRPEGRLVTFKVFAESERTKAQDIRLEIELDLNRRKIDHEVVLLQAESEAALHRTHGRYFYDGRQLLESLIAQLDRRAKILQQELKMLI
jgi:hypothetical protein